MIKVKFLQKIVMLGMMAASFFAHGAEVSVAVAANFTAPMQKIAQGFEQDTGHKALLSFGATGNFYTQIKNGAPYQVLLSADSQTPQRLVTEGAALGASRFTYAMGKLVLWSKNPQTVDGMGLVLRRKPTEKLASANPKLAIANPKLAPYGVAAMQTLEALGVLALWQDKLVVGNNISQTFQFVSTANADLGLVALSQVYKNGQLSEGSAWIVPSNLYQPLFQDAVLLAKGKDSPAALALLKYMRTPAVQQIIQSYGYDLAQSK